MTINLSNPYKSRPVRHLETWAHEGWRVKVYGISGTGDAPSPQLVEAIKREATAKLPVPAVTDGRYGVGFLYAHEGRDRGGYASVNWWENENELFHYQYEAPPDRIGELRPIEQTGGSSACVWDLAVIEHERMAWIECVLANDAGPDLDAYLARTLDADV